MFRIQPQLDGLCFVTVHVTALCTASYALTVLKAFKQQTGRENGKTLRTSVDT